MTTNAAACILRVAMQDPAAARAQNKPYAPALVDKHTAFRLMKTPNCAWIGAEDILGGHTKGFFLFPFNARRSHQILTYLPAGWTEALRDGRAGLIFDQSKEGVGLHDMSMQTWHRQLQALSISPSRIVYMTQNRDFQDAYDHWCKKNGVEERIAIFNYDYHISRFCRESWPDPAAALAEKIRSFENRNEIDKRFVCLNYKPRPMRIALLTRLIKDNYWDDGFISFIGADLDVAEKPKNSFSSQIKKFQALNLAASSEAYLEALATKGPVLFGQDGPATNGTLKRKGVWQLGDSTQYIYRRSAFTLVSDTDMRPTADRITEKPLKPLANCHPTILFGNYGGLSLLKSFGFKTFEPWIDESYDAIEEPEARFLAAYDAFQGFYKMAWDSVREDRELRDVLLYNAEHAMINLPRLYQETLDPKLCREIAGLLPDA